MQLSPAILFLFLTGCTSTVTSETKNTDGYNLNKPDAMYILPDTLREISGITPLSPSLFACIQDENGIIFIYDTERKIIKSQHTFHMDGDYEGITKVENSLYILRSDGTLFQIEDFSSERSQVFTHITGITANNNEGLCHDSKQNRLLIASKSNIGKGRVYKDQRVIYSFDLKSEELKPDPAYIFNVQDIIRFALRNGINLPLKEKKKGEKQPDLKFRTSAVAIHPFTQQLFVLSAADYMLFIFSYNGSLEHIEPLDRNIFNKAEGISFLNNGDMIITNEGQNKRPTLLRFNYKEQP